MTIGPDRTSIGRAYVLRHKGGGMAATPYVKRGGCKGFPEYTGSLSEALILNGDHRNKRWRVSWIELVPVILTIEENHVHP